VLPERAPAGSGVGSARLHVGHAMVGSAMQSVRSAPSGNLKLWARGRAWHQRVHVDGQAREPEDGPWIRNGNVWSTMCMGF
jgi:hypothetical protein